MYTTIHRQHSEEEMKPMVVPKYYNGHKGLYELSRSCMGFSI